MKNKISAGLLFGFVAFIILYAIATITIMFKNIGGFTISAVFQSGFILLVAAVFSLIFIFSGMRALNNVPLKHMPKFLKDVAKEYNSRCDEILETSEKSQIKLDKYKNKVLSDLSEKEILDIKIKKSILRKRIFNACLVFIIFSAISGGLTTLAVKNIQRLNGPNVIKTEAIVTAVQVENNDNPGEESYRLCYVYEDLNGVKHIYNSNSAFSGINFKLGNKITVYYNKFTPEVILDRELPAILLMFGICLFLGGCLGVFISLHKENNNPVVAIITGGIFFTFSAGLFSMFILASGMKFVDILFSGVASYALSIFAIMGFAFMVFGFIQCTQTLVKKIFVRNNENEKKS